MTADGLVWTIDHLPVAVPGGGAGRHFVGRGLQRSARTIDEAIDYLRAHPAAGTTLCTFVADLTSGQAVLAARDDHPVTIPLRDLAEGNPPGRRRPLFP